MSLEGGGHIEPILEVRLFDAGEADPVVTDHGYSWWDLLADSQELASSNPAWGSSRNARHLPLLEFLPEINGVTNRGVFLPQDTLPVHWDILGGSWNELGVKPATGRFRNVRMNQYDSNPVLQWGVRRRLYLPQDAAGVLSLLLPDTPPDFDSATVEPFIRLELGALLNRVAIQLEKDGRCLLLRWDADLWDWAHAVDLPTPEKGAGYSDVEEVFIAWRVKRGRFGVSCDFGKSWVWWGAPESVTIPSHRPILRGAGGEITFGLHKLWEYPGIWRSVPQPTLTSTFFGSALFEPRYDLPPGADIDFADVSDTLAGLAQYEALLTPNSDGQGPVLYSNVLRYVTQSVVGSAEYSTPWTGDEPTNGRCVECRISKGQNLRESSCHLRIKLDPGDTPLKALRRRKIAVYVGIRVFAEDGSFEDRWNETPKFTGYICAQDLSQSEFGDGWQSIEAHAAAHWTRTRWWPTDVRPLGGHLLNDTLDYILNSEGIEGLNLPLYRDWHALGDLFVLDPGSPEEPFELIKVGEDKWATMERLCSYPELELGIDDAGVLFTLQKNPSGIPATTGVSHDYRAKETNDLEELIESVSNRVDYDRSATAAMLTARNQADGSAMRVYAVDGFAESKANAADERFCPWREGEAEELSDPCSPALLVYRLGERAYELFPLQYEPDIEAFLNVPVGRRDTINVFGCQEQGIPDGAAHIVVSEDLEFSQGLDGPSSLKNTFGLFRVPA